MSQLNSLLESANTYKSLQSDAARLASKWAKTGLLEGMNSETDKNNMSMILENQAKQLVTENTQTGGGTATFTAGTGPAGQWAGVALPLVRKVFGQIAAKEFVSVQPMNLPSGLVFYLDFQYGGTQVSSPATAANTVKNPFTIGTSLYGAASPANPNPANTGGFGNFASGGLYGAGRFGYSTQNLVSGAIANTNFNVGNADFYRDMNADSSFAFTTSGVGADNSTVTNVNKVNFLTSVLDANYDKTAIEGFYLGSFTNTPADGSRQYPAFTKLSSGAYFVTPVAGVSTATADVGGVITGAASAVDLNVAPTSTTSVAGVGATFDFTVNGAGNATAAVINNPGEGYVAGDVLTFSAASRPNANAGAAAGVLTITLEAGTAAGSVRGTDALISFFVVAGSVAAGDAAGTILQTLQPTDNNRGDFEDGNVALNAANRPIAIPEINVQMRSEAIVAKTKKLKAVWTPEFAQDLNAYHSLDAEAELTSIMSEYISLEIDQEILAMLIEDAGAGDEYWSAQNNLAIDANGVVNNALGFFNSQGQWFQTLGTKVQKLSNIIHQRTLRGGANFMVCSPTIATVIESIPGFASNSDGDAAKMSYAFGVQKAGSMNGRYQVYKNPYMTDNTILLGYRGSQFLEAGAVFAPYIPLIMTPMVYDPTTFTPRKGLLTRYAKKMIRPEFYGRIYVSNLNTI
jgi:hypothetical protein|tara:strand:+ start:6010 stop:8070 length:2061 start_codon:yes stop_codon:yes gene_type:complete